MARRLARSTVAGNGDGLFAPGANATIRVAQSTMTGNRNGFDIAGASVVSYGDNYIYGNTGNIGALGSVAKQ